MSDATFSSAAAVSSLSSSSTPQKHLLLLFLPLFQVQWIYEGAVYNLRTMERILSGCLDLVVAEVVQGQPLSPVILVVIDKQP